MKNLITLLTLFFAVTTQAASSDILFSDLTAVQVEHGEFAGADQINFSLNLEKETLNIVSSRSFRCPTDAYCAQVMPVPSVISLPIVNIEENACGWVTYTAIGDRTAVDGLREIITLTDLSQNICHVLSVNPGIKVSYSSYNPWVDETATSVFTGSDLVALLPPQVLPLPIVLENE